MFSHVDTWHFQYIETPVQRYEQQTFTALFCTLKSDFTDVNVLNFKTFYYISALPSLWQPHVTGALGRSWHWQLKSAFLDSKRLFKLISDRCINTFWFNFWKLITLNHCCSNWFLIVFFRVFSIGPQSLEGSNFRKVPHVFFGLKNFLLSCP